MWWKPVGVVGLWLLLIAVPHLGAGPALQMAVPPTPVQAKAAAEASDPGDPPLRSTAADEAAPRREAATAVVTIKFKNALDKNITLLQASLALDGQPLAPVTDLEPQKENLVFSGHVEPGAHIVTTHLTCQGGPRGPFTYLEKYRFHVDSDQNVMAIDNRAVVFTISAVRRKGINRSPDAMVGVSIYNELLPQPLTEKN